MLGQLTSAAWASAREEATRSPARQRAQPKFSCREFCNDMRSDSPMQIGPGPAFRSSTFHRSIVQTLRFDDTNSSPNSSPAVAREKCARVEFPDPVRRNFAVRARCNAHRSADRALDTARFPSAQIPQLAHGQTNSACRNGSRFTTTRMMLSRAAVILP